MPATLCDCGIHGGAWSAGHSGKFAITPASWPKLDLVAGGDQLSFGSRSSALRTSGRLSSGAGGAASQADQWKADATRVCQGYWPVGISELLAGQTRSLASRLFVLWSLAGHHATLVPARQPRLGTRLRWNSRADPRRLFASASPIEHVTAKTPPFFCFTHEQSDVHWSPLPQPADARERLTKCIMKATTTWFPNAAIYRPSSILFDGWPPTFLLTPRSS
ncbi:MAG: hypothetical protein R3C56_24445 [Pirellulaceae bacterium]